MNPEAKELVIPSQPFSILSIASKKLALDVTNHQVVQKGLNIPVQKDFIQQNLIGLEYKEKQKKEVKLWETLIQSKQKDIFAGKRTPYLPKSLIHENESKLISKGLLCEYKANLFVGCRDGTIRSILFHPSSEEKLNENEQVHTWEPFNNSVVKQMVICQGKMFLLSLSSVLKIFDIDQWLADNSIGTPKMIFSQSDVSAFEIRQKGEIYKLAYTIANQIKTVKIMDGKVVLNSTKSRDLKDVFADMIHISTQKDDKRVFISDRLKIVQETKENQLNLTEDNSALEVKGLFADNEHLISFSNDNIRQELRIQLIELPPLPPPKKLPTSESEQQLTLSPVNSPQGVEDGRAIQGESPCPALILNAEIMQISFEQQKEEVKVQVKPDVRKKTRFQKAVRGGVVALSLDAFGSPPKAEPKPVIQPVVINMIPTEPEKPPTINITEVPLAQAVGECIAVCKNKYLSEGKMNYLITGSKGITIYNGKEFIFTLKTEFQVAMSIFSNDGKYLILLGEDGIIRYVQWIPKFNNDESKIQDTSITEVSAAPNGKFYAQLSSNQTQIKLFNYQIKSCIHTIKDLPGCVLMNFTANSEAFMYITVSPFQEESESAQDKDQPKDDIYLLYIVKLDSFSDEKPIKLSVQGYPKQVECNLDMQQIYIISKSEYSNSSSLYVFNFCQEEPVRKIRFINAITMTADQQQLAFVDASGIIFIHYLPTWQMINSITFLAETENTFNVTFFQNGKILIAQSISSVFGINPFTQNIEFKISHSSQIGDCGRAQILYDSFIGFIDNENSLCVYDVFSKSTGQECKLISYPLRGIKKVINKKYGKKMNYSWAFVSNYMLFSLDKTDQFLYKKNPFVHQAYSLEDQMKSPFKSMDGFYLPMLRGGPILSTGSFGEIYDSALEQLQQGDNSEAVQILQTPIYPYKLNALHYFALTHNQAGVEMCFKKNVRWITDMFSKSPLFYALKSGDKSITESVIKGLFETEPGERVAVMRTVPITILLKHATSFLGPLFREAGYSEPQCSQYCGGSSIPVVFDLDETRFSDSLNPIYDFQIKEQLHPRSKKKGKKQGIATIVLNNPVPASYSEESIELLEAIAECGSDEVVRSRPITLILNRKWKSGSFKFYVVQYIMYFILLFNLAFVDFFESQAFISTQLTLALFINLYFFLYQFTQICIYKLDFFKKLSNYMEITRLILIFQILISKSGLDYHAPKNLYPITYFLVWSKILTYLQIFKPTRYLMKMIYEIISDISTFLIILFMTILSYAQINHSFATPKEDGSVTSFYDEMRIGYVLAFGELGDFMVDDYLKFFIFTLFSFFIPLVLLNMLIAIMSDSYARVQNNAVAADCRALAEMELELERFINFFLSKFRPHLVEDIYLYCFCTYVIEGEEEEDWEGTVGQLKAAINSACDEMKARIIESVNLQVREKTHQVIERMGKSGVESISKFDQTQKMVERRSLEILQKVGEAQQQMRDNHNDGSEAIKQMQSKLEEESRKIIDETNFKMRNIIGEIASGKAMSVSEEGMSGSSMSRTIEMLTAKIEELIEITYEQEKPNNSQIEEMAETLRQLQSSTKTTNERVFQQSYLDNPFRLTQSDSEAKIKSNNEKMRIAIMDGIQECFKGKEGEETIFRKVLTDIKIMLDQQDKFGIGQKKNTKELKLITQVLELIRNSYTDLKIDLESKMGPIQKELQVLRGVIKDK